MQLIRDVLVRRGVQLPSHVPSYSESEWPRTDTLISPTADILMVSSPRFRQDLVTVSGLLHADEVLAIVDRAEVPMMFGNPLDTVQSDAGVWVRVRTADNKYGWIPAEPVESAYLAKIVRLPVPETTRQKNQPSTAPIIAVALLVGVF